MRVTPPYTHPELQTLATHISCSGSRVQITPKKGEGEGDEGFDEPPEVKELLEELGENRAAAAAAASGTVAVPGGPFGFVSTIATGAIVATTIAIIVACDILDDIAFRTPLGAQKVLCTMRIPEGGVDALSSALCY